MVCNRNWNCLLWEWGTKGTKNRPLATSPTRRWTRSSYFECNCVGPVRRTTGLAISGVFGAGKTRLTTGKRLVVWKRARSRKLFGRNSPSAPLLWDAKLSILKPMLWGALPCDIWTALRVHSVGKYDNSWEWHDQFVPCQQLGLWIQRLHCLQRSHHLCWHDSPYSYCPCPNQRWFPDWRSDLPQDE